MMFSFRGPRPAVPLNHVLIFALLFFNAGFFAKVFAQPADKSLPNHLLVDGLVNAFATRSNVLYVGGSFIAVSVEGATERFPRTNLAAYDLVARRILDWNPQTDGGVNAIVATDTTVYVGGSFTNVNGQRRLNLAALTSSNGAILNWRPDPDLMVNALLLHRDSLYVGGTFRSFGGVPQTNLVEVDLKTGLASSWEPGISRGTILAMATLSNSLYVGGLFRTVGNVPRVGAAAFDLSSKQLLPWNVGATGVVMAIAVDPDAVYLGGRFDWIAGVNQSNLAKVSAITGNLLPWNPRPDHEVYSLALDKDGIIYLAGYFSNVGGQPRKGGLAALRADNAALLDWAPGALFFPKVLHLHQNVLHAGGFFLRGQEINGSMAFQLGSQVSAPLIIRNTFEVLPNKTIRFKVQATGGGRVQFSSDLSNWSTLQNLPSGSAEHEVLDSAAPNRIRTFYRISAP
jgi:hypothetical protein